MIDEKIILSEISNLKKNVKSENCDYSAGYISALSTIEGFIAGQDKNDGWILCSDRLPTESGEYNVTDECGISTTLYYEKEDNRWVDIVEHYSVYYPSAWQPLPEPYKLKGGIEDE